MKKVIYVIGCGTSKAQQLYELLPLLQAANWEVCVILTPSAIKFVDLERLAILTNYPVRSAYKRPEDPDVLPPADALLVYPATFNTLNKWALGITDTLAVGLLCEYTVKVPILAIPMMSGDLAAHPAFARSLRLLRRYGVHVLYDRQKYAPGNKVPSEIIIHVLQSMIETQ
jgi:phosphopantothenoylcysteine synthetase/decarboxylase